MTVAVTLVLRIRLTGTVMISCDRMAKSARFPGTKDPRADSVKEACAGSIVIPNCNCETSNIL